MTTPLKHFQIFIKGTKFPWSLQELLLTEHLRNWRMIALYW